MAIRWRNCRTASRCWARPMIVPSRRWCIPRRNIYGVQFHPEVTHSEFGQRILENFVRRVCRSGFELAPFFGGDHRSHQDGHSRARRPDEERAVFRERRRRLVGRVQVVRRRTRRGSRPWRLCRYRVHAQERIRRGDVGVREGRIQERAPARRLGRVPAAPSAARRIRRPSASESASRFSRSRTTCSSICRPASGCSARARSIPTPSSRAARVNRRSSRRITTACLSCCGASRPARSSSRSRSSTRTRSAKSDARSGCRCASSRSSRFRVRVSPCASSAPTSRRRGRRTRSSAKWRRAST